MGENLALVVKPGQIRLCGRRKVRAGARPLRQRLGLVALTLLPFVLTPGASFTITVGAAVEGDRRAALHVWAGTALGLGVIAAAVKGAGGRVPVIPGCATNDTRRTVAGAQRAAGLFHVAQVARNQQPLNILAQALLIHGLRSSSGRCRVKRCASCRAFRAVCGVIGAKCTVLPGTSWLIRAVSSESAVPIFG